MKKVMIIALIFAASGIVLKLCSHTSSPKKILQSFVLIPEEVVVTGFGSIRGIAGAVMVFELHAEARDFEELVKRQFTISADDTERARARHLLEQYGDFSVADLADFSLFLAERDSYSLVILIKSPKGYCVITR